MTSKRDTSTLKSISGLDIPNWTTFQMYVFAFAKWRFSNKFYLHLEKKSAIFQKWSEE